MSLIRVSGDAGEGQVETGAFPAAVATFTDALALDPENDEIKADLEHAKRKIQALELQKAGEAQLSKGDYAAAAATLMKSMDIDPYNDAVAEEEALAMKMAKGLELTWHDKLYRFLNSPSSSLAALGLATFITLATVVFTIVLAIQTTQNEQTEDQKLGWFFFDTGFAIICVLP